MLCSGVTKKNALFRNRGIKKKAKFESWSSVSMLKISTGRWKLQGRPLMKDLGLRWLLMYVIFLSTLMKFNVILVWSRFGFQERSRIMLRFADLVEKHSEELAALETWDNGKTYQQAKTAEIPMLARLFRYYAGWYINQIKISMLFCSLVKFCKINHSWFLLWWCRMGG